MVEIRTGVPLGFRAADRVAADAGRVHADLAALTRQLVDRWPGWLLPLAHPLLEAFPRFRDDEHAHVGMLGAAILGAHGGIHARLVGLDPQMVGVAGDQVHLAGETGSPEARSEEHT